MKMTIDMLESFGACGTYTQRFRREFPVSTEEYRDGVEVTRVVCEEKYELFDWSWAASEFLTDAARRTWNTMISPGDPVVDGFNTASRELQEARREALRAWQEQYGQRNDYPDYDTPREAERAYNEVLRPFSERADELDKQRSRHTAGSIGELLQDPTNFSEKLVRALAEEERRRERRERETVRVAEQAVQDAKSRVETSQQEIEDAKRRTTNAKRRITEWTAKLPELEKQLVAARAQYAQRQVQRAQERVDEAQRQLEQYQQQVAEAEALAQAAEAEVEAQTEAAPATA